ARRGLHSYPRRVGERGDAGDRPQRRPLLPGGGEVGGDWGGDLLVGDAHCRRVGDSGQQVVFDGDGEGEGALLGVGVRRSADVVVAVACGTHRARRVGGAIAPGDGGGEVARGCLHSPPRRIGEGGDGEVGRGGRALQHTAGGGHHRSGDLLVGDH